MIIMVPCTQGGPLQKSAWFRSKSAKALPGVDLSKSAKVVHLPGGGDDFPPPLVSLCGGQICKSCVRLASKSAKVWRPAGRRAGGRSSPLLQKYCPSVGANLQKYGPSVGGANLQKWCTFLMSTTPPRLLPHKDESSRRREKKKIYSL